MGQYWGLNILIQASLDPAPSYFMTGVCHHAQLFFFFSVEMGVSQTFLPGLNCNCDPPNLNLTYLGMTDVCHCAQVLVEMRSHECFAWAGLEVQSSQSYPPK
jgi:hypothetical protein